MLTINPCNPDDAYGGLVASFLARVFPANLGNMSQVLDALTEAFVSSGQNRQGPAPTPEGYVAIRRVLLHYIERQEPISVLVPWGSKKPKNSMSIDVADLFALKQLEALHNRVRAVYAPGVHVNVGIEDLGGRFLWKDRESLSSSATYVNEFVRLTEILGYSWLEAVPESTLAGPEFEQAAQAMSCRILPYLTRPFEKHASLALMHEAGWAGDLPDVQVDFYLRQYERYYPDLDEGERRQMLARYLAQSWARYKVNAKLKYPEWGSNYVQINFPQPVPGIPAHLGDRRLYYRTLPMRFARTHIPSWRARGYLQISHDEAVPKIATVFDVPEDLHPLDVQLSNGRDSVVVDASYQVKE